MSMKALARKIRDAFGREQDGETVKIEHPNFWMYQ